MIDASPLQTTVLFTVGPIPVSNAVATTWAIMAFLAVGSWLSTRRLRIHPGRWQTVLEILVETIRNQISQILQRDATPFVPLIGTLFIFLVVANLVVVVPGTTPPTAHVETPAALAAIVFLSVQYFGIRSRGIWGYLKSYAKPNPVMLPINILSGFTRVFSLMIRLFGNIMSHEFIIAIVVVLGALFLPIPFMALAVLLGLIQAYIFAVLATVFIGAAVGDAGRD